MGMFTKIPKNTFDELQVDAGMLATTFDPANPDSIPEDAILCATTGGINAVCQPEYVDYFEDVDNAPNNTKEGKRITGWNCTISTTSISMGSKSIQYSLGAADVNTVTTENEGTTTIRILPRRNAELSDFKDLWWIGDKANGGFVAIRLINALSTGGFSLQTTKDGKGQNSIELTGHVSIENQDVMPMEFYVSDPVDDTGA